MKRLRENLFIQFTVASFVVMVLVALSVTLFQSRTLRSQAVSAAIAEAIFDSTKLFDEISPADLQAPMIGQRYELFDNFVKTSIISNRTVRVKLWAKDGTVIYADETSIIGKKFPGNEQIEKALSGRVAFEVTEPDAPENEAERQLGTIIEVYSPIVFTGDTKPAGVYEIYQAYQPTESLISDTNQVIFWSVGLGFLLLYGLVVSGVWRGWHTITSQRAEVARYTGQLQLALSDLKNASLDTINRLSRAAEYRDEDTGDHIGRMANYAVAIARSMGMNREEIEAIQYAAPMHDIGKLGIPDRVLLKPGALDPDEWEIMKTHTAIGERILAGSKAEFIRLAEVITRTHHEKWDGTGYPRGLKHDEIPLVGRIAAVADVFDALTSVRPYRKPISPEEAFDMIEKGSGTNFDPEVVNCFLSIKDSILKEYRRQNL